LIERFVKFNRIGCGQGSVAFARRRNHPDRADACCAVTQFVPYLTGESGNRCFPAGARNRGNGRWLPRKDFRRSEGKQTSWIGSTNKRHGVRQCVRALLGYDGHGPIACSLFYETRAVGSVTRNRDEQETRFYLAAVGSDANNLDSIKPRIGRCLRQKITQLHRVSFALTSSI
jgi:hypothetical protein